MTQKKDIKEVMGDFMPEAPANAWEAIDQQLSAESMQDIRENLEDFQPNTDIAAWQKVNKRLIFDRFMTFQSNRFNIVYLLLLLIFFSGALMFASPSIFSDEKYQPNKQLALNTENQSIQDSLKNNTAGNTASDNQNIDNTVSGNALAGQSDIPGGRPADQYYIPPYQGNNKNNQNSGNDNASNNTNNADNQPKNDLTNNPQSIEEWIELNPAFVPKIKPYKLKVQKNLSQRIAGFNPLPDTLGVDAFGEPILSEKSKFAVSLGLYGNTNITSYHLNNNAGLIDDNTDIDQIFNQYSSPNISYAANLNLDYINNHMIFSTGLGYQQVSETFSANVPTIMIDSVGTYNVFDTEGWVYDTTYYINIDTLAITGDTVYMPYVDSIWGPTQDSSIVYIYDSINAKKLISEKSIVRYVNIPIWFGYRQSTEHWELQAQAGLITSIPIYQQVTWYNKATNEYIYSENAPFKDVIFTAGLRAFAARRLNENWLIGVEPSYYYRLNGLFDKSYPLNTQQHVFRLGVRVQYQF